MNAGFEVVRSGLRQAAGEFGTESVAFWAIMPPEGPAGAAGGSPEFDAALARVLTAIGGRHVQLAAAIAGRGRDLREIGQGYREAEEAVGGMIDRIMDSGALG